MGLYTYKCRECGETFDVELRITEAPLKKCIKCEQEECLDRVFTKGISYINKSGGFYSNSNV